MSTNQRIKPKIPLRTFATVNNLLTYKQKENLQHVIFALTRQDYTTTDQEQRTMTQCKIEFTYQSQKPPNFKVVLEW